MLHQYTVHHDSYCMCTIGVTLGPGTTATPRPLSEKGIASVKEQATADNMPV